MAVRKVLRSRVKFSGRCGIALLLVSLKPAQVHFTQGSLLWIAYVSLQFIA